MTGVRWDWMAALSGGVSLHNVLEHLWLVKWLIEYISSNVGNLPVGGCTI